MDNEDRIERVITLPQPPERVWQALTEPAQLARWFGHRAEVDLRVGGDIFFGWGSGEIARARIEVIDPPRCFAFRWRPYKSDPELPIETGGPTTLVEFSLEQIPQGTRLTLVESGFAVLPAEIYAKSLADNQQGWTEELANLAAYIQGD
jgi:uncharacterized protein YndB with AHSA1/START domain